MNPSHLPDPTPIDLLRHGEPEGGDRYRGSLDDPLSAKGWEQMRQAIAHLPSGHWQVVVSSPLQRCAAFARAVASESAVPLILDEGFREMSFGAWEGKTAAQILDAQGGDELVRFWQDPLHNPPPGGEPLPELLQRVIKAWETLLVDHAGKSILLVAHGGVIRALLSHLLAIPPEHLSRLLVPYACLTRLRVDRLPHGSMPRLISHGAPLP